VLILTSALLQLNARGRAVLSVTNDNFLEQQNVMLFFFRRDSLKCLDTLACQEPLDCLAYAEEFPNRNASSLGKPESRFSN
jgi:hypothetical protein